MSYGFQMIQVKDTVVSKEGREARVEFIRAWPDGSGVVLLQWLDLPYSAPVWASLRSVHKV